ncbi:MAG: T9SS type B sorting domain-containing protein, partial [Flavobacteriales bacterium]|nr:T9SS type B sorting domain-containing protein [Flavobacteriales bacterium]
SPYGCASSDTVLVLVNYAKRVGVPSAFSPNGDGNNDVLFVKGEGIVNMSFQLYNRYGEMIFQSDDQRIGWDGTYKGIESPIGTYVWKIWYQEYSGEEGKAIGHVNLVR